jgi:peptidoglycan/LPS O-acetylase OafA/YrhL
MEEKVYFPGLNGLRFIAASLVIIFHLEYKKVCFSLPNFFGFKFMSVIGDLGVSLFFVLSGFLITYLLLKEKRQSGTVAIKKFYIRRILRILPLYYFIILLGFFILPKFNLFYIPLKSELIDYSNLLQISLFIFFMANIGCILYGNLPYIDQTWSIGVEEQFYFLWPFLIKKFKNVHIFLFLIIIIIPILRYSFSHNSNLLIYRVLERQRFGCMAIGGLFAYLLFNKSSFLLYFYNQKVQILTYLFTIICLIRGISFNYLHHEIYGLFFAIIIINIATNPSKIITLNNPIFDYLGKISYGIYMYHNIFVVLTIKFLSQYNVAGNSFTYLLLSIILTFGFTILFSAISYELFEKYFIKKKSRYMIIKSSNENDSILVSS